MNKEIDARAMDCPRPVIMTKKELDNLKEGSITTIVDNDVARENVSKLVASMGYNFNVEEKDGDFYININKDGEMVEEVKEDKKLKNMTIGISSDTMGSGDDTLGKILMKSFIYTVSETEPYPSTIVFYNGGVRLTVEGSEVIDELIALEGKGVEIISCGTCLDFLELKERLKVGSISNMYTIYEKLKDKDSNLIIG
ncbi:sulfurtransferase-like selenium metabolism protein YedF [Tissierella creatinophila]|uniref:SirA-like protein n=1 Tax=Tissierella creatinophila DSM 6911 TaxID=1123403 RepID=A0A1U7M805_TISCR|nr:sulfurtransferase-like selenium metabolism protein YedF [Tissierella creatinophila]OLS03411.1 SirA-like protein [Tissierella creatinophila DSM 6911]